MINKTQPIYLDHNATTPIAAEVAAAMQPFLTNFFGNPSSTHWYGLQAKKAVENARTQIAGLLNCLPEEIIFTSGGSEANNYAIKGVAFSLQQKGRHLITSQIEHPAVINVHKYLENEFNFKVTYLPVDEYGVIDLVALRDAIRSDTILISIMHANNEVGTIQPIAEISKIARQHGILLHTDAAQSVGKITTDVQELGVDLLSIAGHKLYAPKGIGALYVRTGLQLKPLIHGAGHEAGRRAGTENVLEIVGLGAACQLAQEKAAERQQHSQTRRDQLWNGLKAALPGIILNGHPEKRLPNTLNITFPGVDANTLLDELDTIAASPGAACHSDLVEPSPVLLAMHIPADLATSTIRFSTGLLNNKSQIDQAIQEITAAIQRLKPDSPSEQVLSDFIDIKLTHFTHGLGCACKLRPQNLEKILKSLPVLPNPAVLVGTATADDAAVYKINNELALVQTVDFFTPVVDNPYQFGAIAAANSLSDIYAMGATPLFALNVVGFPEKRLPLAVLEEILRGAADKAHEAGIPILGGHTVEDSEPKFGLTVTGQVHPDKVLTNAGAKPGDALILTKPIGLGILTTALKRGLLDSETKLEIFEIMSRLNRDAAEVMQHFTIHACTDITGFGLLGHLKEMTTASGVDAQIQVRAVPILPLAEDLVRSNLIPGGSIANLDYVSPWVQWDPTISPVQKQILADAQTSGGLLIALPTAAQEAFCQALKIKGVKIAAMIGKITGSGSGMIRVTA